MGLRVTVFYIILFINFTDVKIHTRERSHGM
jgi:hypothetical protein